MGVFCSPLGRLSRDYCGWDSLLGWVSGGVGAASRASYAPLCCWLGGGCSHWGRHPRSLSLILLILRAAIKVALITTLSNTLLLIKKIKIII